MYKRVLTFAYETYAVFKVNFEQQFSAEEYLAGTQHRVLMAEEPFVKDIKKPGGCGEHVPFAALSEDTFE